MRFEEYFNYDQEYDGFVEDWQYLRSIIYYHPFQKSQIVYKKGNGNYYMYNDEYSEKMIWDESLIFNL